MQICGIDEAGRGPVISSLVICGVMMEESDIEKLKSLGVRDSKLIAQPKREIIEKEIKRIARYHLIVIEPAEIDVALNSTEINLNWLEALKSVEIIKELKPDRAILDCPATDPDKYKDYIINALDKTGYTKKTEIISEHKADDTYLIVGAASILAKVMRENIIKKLKDKYGDFGSGYPSDPKTQEFLKKNWKKYPDIFRQTWSSYKRYSKQKKQKRLGDF